MPRKPQFNENHSLLACVNAARLAALGQIRWVPQPWLASAVPARLPPKSPKISIRQGQPRVPSRTPCSAALFQRMTTFAVTSPSVQAPVEATVTMAISAMLQPRLLNLRSIRTYVFLNVQRHSTSRCEGQELTCFRSILLQSPGPAVFKALSSSAALIADLTSLQHQL